MNRRRVIMSLASFAIAPSLGPLGFNRNRHLQNILVACIGKSGRRVYNKLKQFNASDLLQPMIVETEAELTSVLQSVSRQRVIVVGEIDAQFDGPLTWKMLRLARMQPNCCHNFSAFVVYPYLTAEELTRSISPDRIPRWAYSEVGFVRVVNAGSSEEDNVQSRWNLKYFNNDITKVERQVARCVAKVQVVENWR